MKYSKQREAVLDYLTHTHSHPTADDIYSALRADMPAISLATVYRNLNQLCESGTIRRIGSIGGKEHFDGFTEPHYHFVCTKCGEVSDTDIPLIESIETEAWERSGLEIDFYSLVFYGVCKKCKKADEA